MQLLICGPCNAAFNHETFCATLRRVATGLADKPHNQHAHGRRPCPNMVWDVFLGEHTQCVCSHGRLFTVEDNGRFFEEIKPEFGEFGEDGRICFSGHAHETENEAILCELRGPS